MAQLYSTGVQQFDSGPAYKPVIVEALNYSTFSSGTSAMSAVYQTYNALLARVRGLVEPSGSTISLRCVTAESASDVSALGTAARSVLTSSGSTHLPLATTAARYRTFVGLGRFTAFVASEKGGSTANSFSVNAEFI